ncbi:hypothetical protein HQO24_13565 [Rhodococcus fascians]|nr:hypothetical protein [Rhodococcus fascians]MBY4397513.1 hypothetical protein [Rhodococcus fascians]MBY4406333.1 hypothetical protein [Rhodococcus fascians]MBY4422098.1 hypothetical protein [Rhodococcus fascians]MBY4461593.1 hypothetical protein [Rhodococcus fascians]
MTSIVKPKARQHLALLRGPILSLASQGTGVVQLALLIWQNGANTSTDAYFYLWNLGLLPTSTLLVGVLYPMLLSERRISRRGVNILLWSAPVLGLAFVGVGAAWLEWNGKLGSALLPIVVCSAANAFVQALVWSRAVLSEAEGDPRWMSGIALPANILAVATLIAPWSNPVQAVTAMLCALIVGNVGLLVVMRMMGVGQHILDTVPKQTSGSKSGAGWFFARSSVGQVALVLIQSTAVLLPASSLTILSVATKIVGAASATLVNAVVPTLVHQSTDSPKAGHKFLSVLWIGLAPIGIAGGIIAAVWFREFLIPVVIVGVWLVSATTAAVAQRMTFRFLPPSASRLTMISVSAVALAVIASSRMSTFDLNVLLAAYAAVDAAGAVLLLFALKNNWIGLWTLLCAAFLAGAWIGSLTS